MIEKIENYLKKIEQVVEKGPYKNNWESLSHISVPKWYKDAKFGIFIHWGVFSVPAYANEWYAREMNLVGHRVYEYHKKVYGEQKEFDYKKLIPMFKAEKYNAEEWAALFKKSGARYVMPVAEHHDGFQMYDSDLSQWCVSKMGPCKDTMILLKEAVEKQGMAFCVSSHRAEHNWFFDGSHDFDSGVPKNPEYGDMYWPNKIAGFGDDGSKLHIVTLAPPEKDFLDDWLVRTCELVDKYKPKIVYFDFGIENLAFRNHVQMFAAYYYNRGIEWGMDTVINYKYDSMKLHTAVKDVERGKMDCISPDIWQCDTSVAKNSWSYSVDNDYKQSEDILCDFVDIISKNGSLLLNVGPKADGTIPDEDRKILEEIGTWMKQNEEAIYGSTYWKIFGEGPTKVSGGAFTDISRSSFTYKDIRFTCKPDALYAFVMKMPEDGVVKIKTLKLASKDFNTQVTDISVLGFEEKPEFIQWTDALTIKVNHVHSTYPVCFKISYM